MKKILPILLCLASPALADDYNVDVSYIFGDRLLIRNYDYDDTTYIPIIELESKNDPMAIFYPENIKLNGDTRTMAVMFEDTQDAIDDMDLRMDAMESESFLTAASLTPYLTTSAAASTYVPKTLTINGYALSTNRVLTADDIGDGTTNKAYTATEKTKLSGIASGATANDTDANLKARANHTGTQNASTISDFSTTTRSLISVTGNGSYNSSTGVITVDAPAARSFAKTTPTLNAAGAQISSTRDAMVSCNVDITVSSLLIGAASGTVTLRYADNSGMSTNLVSVQTGNSATGGVLSLVNTNTVTLTGIIPAGKYRQLTSATSSGTVSYGTPNCQEVLL